MDLFKRKLLIIVCSLCGFIAAGAAFYMWKPSYQSTAKLLFRYVANNRNPIDDEKTAVDVQQTEDGQRILGSEIQILKSFDIAKTVADIVQPAKILAPYQGGTNEDAAANQILVGLVAEPMPGSAIVHVTFTHRDFSIVKQVLELMITNYQTKEQDIREKPGAIDDYLTQQKSIISSRLAEYCRQAGQGQERLGNR